MLADFAFLLAFTPGGAPGGGAPPCCRAARATPPARALLRQPGPPTRALLPPLLSRLRLHRAHSAGGRVLGRAGLAVLKGWRPGGCSVQPEGLVSPEPSDLRHCVPCCRRTTSSPASTSWAACSQGMAPSGAPTPWHCAVFARLRSGGGGRRGCSLPCRLLRRIPPTSSTPHCVQMYFSVLPRRGHWPDFQPFRNLQVRRQGRVPSVLFGRVCWHPLARRLLVAPDCRP